MKVSRLLFVWAILLTTKIFGQYEGTNIVNVGDQMPSFKIVLQNGEIINSSSFKGKVVLINFFATWCGPCLRELPELEKKVWEKHKSNPKFKLLEIARDQSESVIQPFKAKHKFDFPMYPDISKIIYSLFATQYIPRNYIVDETGKIVYSSVSYSPEEFDKMVSVLDNLLK